MQASFSARDTTREDDIVEILESILRKTGFAQQFAHDGYAESVELKGKKAKWAVRKQFTMQDILQASAIHLFICAYSAEAVQTAGHSPSQCYIF